MGRRPRNEAFEDVVDTLSIRGVTADSCGYSIGVAPVRSLKLVLAGQHVHARWPSYVDGGWRLSRRRSERQQWLHRPQCGRGSRPPRQRERSTTGPALALTWRQDLAVVGATDKPSTPPRYRVGRGRVARRGVLAAGQDAVAREPPRASSALLFVAGLRAFAGAAGGRAGNPPP
jgi:hypothetical protein